MAADVIVDVRDLHKRLGGRWVHRGVDLQVEEGEVLAVVGSSGSGKTTLLRQIIGLLKPDRGTVRVLGQDVYKVDLYSAQALRSQWGVLFQQGALFSGLNVFENIAFPLREMAVLGESLREDYIHELVMVKLELVGLDPEDAWKMPAELSGGMVKRVALARALALDAGLLFLDEPTTGLDPDSASEFDHLLSDLHSELRLTALMVTHDVNSLAALSDRVAVLADGKVVALGRPSEVARMDHPFIQAFFHGERGQPVLDKLE
ncbi:MAG TPA: ATP-binding cassette domain-containing protein [Gammaproteobacteria bacterium]|nr:ATP-binding cassette domain-containing protein [Gammaproteobacteria bacterium]